MTTWLQDRERWKRAALHFLKNPFGRGFEKPHKRNALSELLHVTMNIPVEHTRRHAQGMTKIYLGLIVFFLVATATTPGC